MNVFGTSGMGGRARICVVLASVALACLVLVGGGAAAAGPAADMQAAHAAYLTQGTTLGAGGSAVAATPEMLTSALALQAAHGAYLTQGTTLGAGTGGSVVAMTPEMLRSALVASRTDGTMLTRGAPGYVTIVPPVTQPVGQAAPVSEPGFGGGMAVLIACAALATVGLIVAFSARSRSRAARAGKTAEPAALHPTASAPAKPDDRLRHAA